jgi:plastocyanin
VAVLHRLRQRGGSRLSRVLAVAASLVLVAGVSLALAGCGAEVDPELRPDSLLQDSLGLDDRDRVHEVVVATLAGVEVARPGTVEVEPGAWVAFRVGDRRVHSVAFELDSLAPAARRAVERGGQDASPPLVEEGARYLVSFEGAPPGRYPYRMEGTGEPSRGVVVVREPGA